MTDRERSYALPSWQYRDPAEVVERIDARAPVKPECGEQPKYKRSYGLLSPETLRMVKRMRIRELMERLK